ncbi:MAG: hypothetical protein Q8L49_18380 [Burkholderiaceae bacterium]|nr:hypothetical protein [Burkholderiaceae bacterium]
MNALATDRSTGPARWFYVWMALAGVAIAFGGFVPTYWAKLAGGNFRGAPILHIHGMLFFAWTLFFAAQTTLVATGRTPNHRQWGLAGISLATAMGITVMLAALNSIKAASLIGMGDEARRFTIVSLSGLALFALFLSLAIANVRNPEVHKRWMLLAMVPLSHAAMARLFMTAFAPADAKGPPPVFVAVPPGLFVDLLIVVAMVFDWRTRGRPHRVYVIGGALLLAVQLLSVPIGASATWLAFARWFESLAG